MTDHIRVVTSAPGKNRTQWRPEPGVTDWPSFADWIVNGTLDGSGKYGRPYSPVTLKEAPGRRQNVNLEARHVLTLDADSAGPDYLDRLAEALPFEALSHTTASHTPDAPRWRTLGQRSPRRPRRCRTTSSGASAASGSTSRRPRAPSPWPTPRRGRASSAAGTTGRCSTWTTGSSSPRRWSGRSATRRARTPSPSSWTITSSRRWRTCPAATTAGRRWTVSWRTWRPRRRAAASTSRSSTPRAGSRRWCRPGAGRCATSTDWRRSRCRCARTRGSTSSARRWPAR